MQHPARPRVVALAAVIALHVALFWLVRGSMALHGLRDAPAATVQRVTLRLVQAPMAEAPPQAALVPPRRSDPARKPPQRRSLGLVLSTAAEPTAQTPISVVPPLSTSRAEPAASAPDVSLLDSESTRRAIRASARATSLTAEVARVGGEPHRATTQERLGKSVKNAGHGDCVKGEYAGAGMGLLSLPFLVAAAARGACAQ